MAETFGALDALSPGRATGMPAADRALRAGGGGTRSGDDRAEKIAEVAKHLHGGFPDDHPYADIRIPRSADGVPEVWVPGLSPSSAEMAGELGLPYAFAAFIRPNFAHEAFETYRERFEPSAFGAGPDEPRGMLAVNVACAETDREAARLRASSEAAHRRMRRGAFGPPPTVEEAVDELGGVPDPTPEHLPAGEWSRAVSGSPSTVRSLLEGMTEQVGADEVVVQNLIEDPDDRIESHRLIAEGVGLSPR